MSSIVIARVTSRPWGSVRGEVRRNGIWLHDWLDYTSNTTTWISVKKMDLSLSLSLALSCCDASWSKKFQIVSFRTQFSINNIYEHKRKFIFFPEWSLCRLRVKSGCFIIFSFFSYLITQILIHKNSPTHPSCVLYSTLVLFISYVVVFLDRRQILLFPITPPQITYYILRS